jgi:hydroxymethylpyrimidine/phosphomethylpyrimidine kinase
MRTPPVVLSIAGFDPSSGAGVTADVKTIAAHGCFGATCITALTVQSTRGVRCVEPLAPGLVRDILEELTSDLDVAAVRIGMLGSAEVAGTVAEFLSRSRIPVVVLDPILRSSSGADLLGSAGLEVVRERLLPLSTVVTPNLDEAAALVGFPVTNADRMCEAGRALLGMGAASVVVTGGHLREPIDVLVTVDGSEEFRGERINSRATHGTGCAFATSLACRLALGDPMPVAVRDAKEFVAEAMRRAYPVGKGNGPLHHLFRLNS